MEIFANTLGIPDDHIIQIAVNYLCEAYNSGASSKNTSESKMKLQFYTFALNVDGVVAQHGFVIEDSHNSNRTDSVSCYITFYPTDEEGDIRDKYLIFLRLFVYNLRNAGQRSRKYHVCKVVQFKRANDSVQRFRFENIVIDGKVLGGFSSALDYVYDMLESMKNGSYFK